MERKIKLPFAIRNNILVSIDDVESGIQKDCFCPCCGSLLIARKGDCNVHHFAHAKSECEYGLETALHIFAKQILEESKTIYLPELYAGNYLLHEKIQISINEVYLEKRIGNIVPDVIIVSDGRELIVEIAVTHFADYNKIFKIKKMGIGGIEIDLSPYFSEAVDKIDELLKTILPDLIINGIKSKRWLFSPKSERFVNELKTIPEKKQSHWIKSGTLNYVDDCPINKRIWKSGYKKGKSYANSEYDCPECEYLYMVEKKQRDLGEGNSYSLPFPEYIYCLCNRKNELEGLLKKWNIKK